MTGEAVDVPAQRGASIEFDVEFYTDDLATVPWSDVADYDPTVEVRRKASDALVAASPALEVAGHVASFAIPSTVAAIMAEHGYEWDVRFTVPGSDPGLGVFYWPGPDSPRNTITMGATVTRAAAS